MPRLVDHDQRRKEVADTAWSVIARAGVKGATLGDIAREMGITTGSLAHYFRSKEELIASAFRHGCAKTFLRIETAAAACPPGLDRLRIALEMMMPSYLQSDAGGAATLSYWGAATQEPHFAKVHRENYVVWRGIVNRFLREAQQKGHILDNVDIAMEASALIAVVDGALAGSVLEASHFTDARTKQMLKLAIARISVAPKARPKPGRRGAKRLLEA